MKWGLVLLGCRSLDAQMGCKLRLGLTLAMTARRQRAAPGVTARKSLGRKALLNLRLHARKARHVLVIQRHQLRNDSLVLRSRHATRVPAARSDATEMSRPLAIPRARCARDCFTAVLVQIEKHRRRRPVRQRLAVHPIRAALATTRKDEMRVGTTRPSLFAGRKITSHSLPELQALHCFWRPVVAAGGWTAAALREHV